MCSLNTGRNYVKLPIYRYNEEFIDLLSDSFCEKINNIAHIYLHFQTRSGFDMNSLPFLLPVECWPKNSFYCPGILLNRPSKTYENRNLPYCQIRNDGYIAIFVEKDDYIIIDVSFVCE